MINAIQYVFKNSVSTQLYYYHHRQSVWRKIQNRGLATKYNEDKKFGTSVRMINKLAFLQLNIIKKGIDNNILFYIAYFFLVLIFIFIEMKIIYFSI